MSASAAVVGASAGGLKALAKMLPALPAHLPAAVVIVQHVGADTGTSLPELLAARCQLPVKFAEPGEPVRPGTVYLAAPGYHLLIEPERLFAASVDEPVHHSRPSIDVLFESAADAFGPELVGVVLTGASSDGAHGLRRIVALGGRALVQDPETAEARLMPAAARQAVLEAVVAPLSEIGRALVDMIVDRNAERRPAGAARET